MSRRPKLRSVNSASASSATMTIATPNTAWISGGRPLRKLQYPAAMPRSAIVKMSRIRSMNTVPNVRLSDASLLIRSRYAR